MVSKPVYIYQIRNRVNDKVYIGSTVDPKARWAVYRCKCHNQHLANAFKKYGLESFDFETLACVVNPEMRDVVESEFIARYRACDPYFGYNKIKGGRGSQWSEERKASVQGRVSPNKGKVTSLETRERMSKAMRGRQVSPETRAKMADAARQRRATKFWRSHSGKATRTGPFKSESIEKMRIAARLAWAKRKAKVVSNEC